MDFRQKRKTKFFRMALAILAMIFCAVSVRAGSASVPIYIAGKQFNGHALSISDNLPYQNAIAMDYDSAYDCYYKEFTAGSDNSFSLSTQIGTYSTWRANGISIDAVLYGLNSFSYPVKGFYFQIGKRYLLQHDNYTQTDDGECAPPIEPRSPSNGDTYTIYIKGDFKANRNGTCDTKYTQTIMVQPGSYADNKEEFARTPMYVTGTCTGNALNVNGNYTEEAAAKMTFKNGKYRYVFSTDGGTSVNYSVSRFAPFVCQDLNNNLLSRYNKWGVKKTQYGSSTEYPPTSGKSYYYLWDHNGVFVGKNAGIGAGRNNVATEYDLIQDYEADRVIFDPGSTSALSPGTYELTISEDFSKLKINFKQLFITGSLVGVANSVTNKTGYGESEVRQFDYDSDNDEFIYTFTYSSGNDSFTMSRRSGTYSLWNTYGIRTDKDVYGTDVKIGTIYPLINKEGDRTIAGTETWDLTPGERYTIHVNGDYTKMWILPEDAPVGENKVLIVGTVFNSETALDGLYLDAPVILPYRNNEYSYTATANTGGRFFLYIDEINEDNLLTCPNYLSNENLPYYTYHELTNDPSGWSQQFDASQSTLTLKVTYDAVANKGSLVGINPNSEEPVFYSIDDNNGITNPAADSKVTVDVNGIARITIAPSSTIQRYRFGRYRGANKDTNGGVDAFIENLIRFESGEIDFNQTVDITNYTSYNYIDVPAHYGSSELIFNLFNGTVTFIGDAQPSLYLTGPLTGKPFKTIGGKNNRCDSYAREDVTPFIYDDNSGYFYYTFTASGSNEDAFTMSSTPGSSYETWDLGGYCVKVLETTGETERGLLLGRRYTLWGYSDAAYPNNTGEAPRWLKNSTGGFLSAGEKYTIYVKFDYSSLIVQKGEYSERAADIENIYVNGQVVGCNGCYGLNNTRQMAYDAEHDWYYLKIERNTVGPKKTPNPGPYHPVGQSEYTYDSGTTWYFGISTTPGTEASWNSGRISVEGMTSAQPLRCGVKYDTYPVLGQGGVQQIHDYHTSTSYTIYLSRDKSKLWIRPDLWIIGWLTGQQGQYNYDENGTIRPFIYDPALDAYYYQTDGASASVFEISYCYPGSVSNSQNGSTHYYDWCDGMLGYIPHQFIDGEWKQKYQPDMMIRSNPDWPKFNDPVYSNPAIKDFDNPVDCITQEHVYPLTEGELFFGKGTVTELPYHIKGDMTIQSYNPENIYRIYVTGDLKYGWIQEFPVNMPLTPADFEDNKPHYFLVGTRTADWRLLPEWELKPGDQISGYNTVRLKNRFMYDGYFAFARVDNYEDYVHHRYEIFANSDPEQQNYTSNTTPLLLRSFGKSRCMLYDFTDYEYPHDSNNSITWNFYEIDLLEETQGEISGDEFMRLSTPWRIQELAVALDENGNPLMAAFAGTNDAEVVNQHRTFSLVGSDINYEQEYHFNNVLGTRDLRTMGAAYGKTNELNWANCWISYAPDGTPYYDAYGNTLYMTAYDKEWLQEHDVVFDMRMADGTFLDYNSDNLFFRKASTFSEAELADDPYAWIYGKHGKDISGTNVPLLTIGDQIIQDDAENPNYRYKEKVFNNYDGTESDDYDVIFLGGEDNKDLYGWDCYVLKDVWLRGDFKVWSGWGGNLKSSEGWGSFDNSHRWYFGNFGHTEKDEVRTVEGRDVLTTSKLPNCSDNEKIMYATYRDVDGANFQVGNNGGMTDDDDNLQYFNRIILWYKVNVGIKGASERNGVLQLIQENLAPNIKAQRQTEDGVVVPNKLSAKWNLVENNGDQSKRDWDVLNYQIERYRLVPVVIDGETVMQEELYRRFDVEDLPEGTKVGDLLTNSIVFDDPYSLPAGQYFYRVTVTVRDDEGNLRSKTARSNSVSVSESSKPVILKAHQQMAGVNNDKYTFNVELIPTLSEDNEPLNITSHYSYSIWEDMRHLSITVDNETYQRLKNASDVEIVNADRILLTTSQKANRTISDSYGGPVGWTLAPGYSDGGKPKFVSNGDNTWSITFNLQQWCKNAANTSRVHYFGTVEEFKTGLEIPKIVWHNVRPTENVVNLVAGVQKNPNPYKFRVEAYPDDDEYPSARNNWIAAGLVADNATTHVYAPATYVTMSNLALKATNDTHNVDHSGAPALLPDGAAHPGDGTIVNHVSYHKANEVSAKLSTSSIPLADEVLERCTIDLALGVKPSTSTEFAKGTIEDYDANVYSATVTALPISRVAEDYGTQPNHQPLTGIPSSVRYTPGTYVVYHLPDDETFTTIQRNALPSTLNLASISNPKFNVAQRHGENVIFCGWNKGSDNKYRGHAALGFWAESGVNQNLHHYFGISVPVDDTLDATGTVGLSAHGGQPLAADEDLAAWTYGRVDGITGYQTWTSGEDYDHSKHNWSWLAAGENNYLAVRVEPLFVADSEEEAAIIDFRNLNDLSATCSVIYPISQSADLTFVTTGSSTPAPKRAPGSGSSKVIVPVKMTDNVTVSFADGMMTGIRTVSEEAGEASFYNLQGLRVTRPEQGQVYIMVDNKSGKAEKVIWQNKK